MSVGFLWTFPASESHSILRSSPNPWGNNQERHNHDVEGPTLGVFILREKRKNILHPSARQASKKPLKEKEAEGATRKCTGFERRQFKCHWDNALPAFLNLTLHFEEKVTLTSIHPQESEEQTHPGITSGLILIYICKFKARRICFFNLKHHFPSSC